ncbi:putative transcription factor C2H2 family [Lupinus albus]|uniref:RING-type E3 ubiquitin transferase n=1 Tax=Lupinus albus TaxID=3870 RepID=A0A6A4Q8E2_LUPAL|nr:putative transcription factor C2H2 family [Lupinus albus]
MIIMLFVHAYFRLYLQSSTLKAISRDLKASTIKSLPVFTFSKNSDPIKCVVCLSEFEDGETGRVLPKCKHSFHIECIDMWFESHSTCPLCRVHVEDSGDGETRDEVVVVTLCEPEPGSSSEELNQTDAVVHSSSFVSLMEETSFDSATTSFRSNISRKLSLKRGVESAVRSRARWR